MDSDTKRKRKMNDISERVMALRALDVDRIEETVMLARRLDEWCVKHKFTNLDEVIEFNGLIAQVNRRLNELEIRNTAVTPADTNVIHLDFGTDDTNGKDPA